MNIIKRQRGGLAAADPGPFKIDGLEILGDADMGICQMAYMHSVRDETQIAICAAMNQREAMLDFVAVMHPRAKYNSDEIMCRTCRKKWFKGHREKHTQSCEYAAVIAKMENE